MLVGVLTLAVFLAVPANASIGILGPGSEGPQVVRWQQDLNVYIFVKNTCHPTLTVDGQYGPITTNATRCFQSLNGDAPDGIEGFQTRESMCAFLTRTFPEPNSQTEILLSSVCP